MSQRSSAIVWLVIALVCGVLSLASCGAAGFGIWHVESTLQSLEKQIKEDVEEQDSRKHRGKKLEELDKRIADNDKEVAAYGQYRFFAIAGGVLGVIPPVMALGALFMAFVQFRKKPKDEEDEEDDDEKSRKDD